MENKKFGFYKVTVVAPESKNNWGYSQSLSAKDSEILSNNFFKMVNKVVELGGYVCIDKKQLEYEHNMITRNINVCLPEGASLELAGYVGFIKSISAV